MCSIKSIGLETAKDVLNAPREMLIEKADLEEDTVDDVLRILRAEFDDEEKNAAKKNDAPATDNETSQDSSSTNESAEPSADKES